MSDFTFTPDSNAAAGPSTFPVGSSSSAPAPAPPFAPSASTTDTPPDDNADSKKRRRRVAGSCAECRRLKLKCDKIWPCSSCIRRGCGSICPDGTLEKGTRGFLSRLNQSLPSGEGEGSRGEVAALLQRDASMRKRIRELEEALAAATAQAQAQAQEHGQDEGQPPGEGQADGQDAGGHQQVKVEDEELTRAFGTLVIDEQGRSRYIGASAGSVYLAQADGDEKWHGGEANTASPNGSAPSPPGVFDPYASFMGMSEPSPSATNPAPDEHAALVLHLRSLLPPETEAHHYAEMYFDKMTYMYETVYSQPFFASRLPSVYGHPTSTARPPHPHHFALVFMVLALGTLFDLSLPIPAAKARAESFHQNALAALPAGLWNVDTLPGVQALQLMANYAINWNAQGGGDRCWAMLGHAMRTMQAMGLHRDGSRWGLDEEELEERRRVFWETNMHDRLQSFCFGRPYALSGIHYDCALPSFSQSPAPPLTLAVPPLPDPPTASQTYHPLAFHHHKFSFVPLLGAVIDGAFSASPPSYAAILRLDSEIRKWYRRLPRWMLCTSVGVPLDFAKTPPDHEVQSGGWQFCQDIQIHSIGNMIFETFLHLHRGSFARALNDNPHNPLQHKYAHSVIAATEASRAMINIARGIFVKHPAITSRTWHFLFHSFSAAACQAVLIIRSPTCTLAPLAYRDLQSACELFAHAQGERAEQGLRILRGLASRAEQRLRSAGGAVADTEEDLSGLIGASTRLVNRSEQQLPHPAQLPQMQVPADIQALANAAYPAPPTTTVAAAGVDADSPMAALEQALASSEPMDLGFLDLEPIWAQATNLDANSADWNTFLQQLQTDTDFAVFPTGGGGAQ